MGGRCGGCGWVRHVLHLLLAGPAPAGLGLGVQSHPARHAVKPMADQLARHDRACLTHQHHERGLERIIRVVRIAQQPPADAEHHRAMAAQQLFKCRLVLPADETLQQLPVGLCALPASMCDPAQVVHNSIRLPGGHVDCSDAPTSCLFSIGAGALGASVTYFTFATTFFLRVGLGTLGGFRPTWARPCLSCIFCSFMIIFSANFTVSGLVTSSAASAFRMPWTSTRMRSE